MSAAAWYASLEGIASRGKTAAKATRLGDLHARRVETQGQFFTPSAVARFMWDLAHTAVTPAPGNTISVLDNAIGSGRLVQFATADHHIYGCDPDAVALAPLRDQLHKAGIRADLEVASMEEITATGIDLALINPPFSLQLESPLLTAYPCTHYGRFGPSSATQSHWYALYQAHAAARVTVALLPRTAADQLHQHPELHRDLHAIIDLSANAFLEEGANVSTSVCLFIRGRGVASAPVRVNGTDEARERWDDIQAPGQIDHNHLRRVRFTLRDLTTESPVFTGPVTGNTAVRIDRRGRHIKLGFACALTEARVVNALMGDRLGYENHLGNRLPTGIRYSGSGKLLIDVLLTFNSPLGGLEALSREITAAGGAPCPTADLVGYLKRRWRAVQVESTPLQRTVYDPAGQHGNDSLDGVAAIAKKAHFPDPKNILSGAVRKGQSVRLIADQGDRYRYEGHPAMPPMNRDALAHVLEVPKKTEAVGGWRQIHEGRRIAFPQRAADLSLRLTRNGGDAFLGSWQFQRDDVVELSMTRGTIAGHQMALGKSRIAAGCCLLGGRHNAIVVEAGLIDEMEAQFKAFGLPPSEFTIIRRPSDTVSLARINLVSYHSLRQTYGGRSLATWLRRRFHTVCADEGSLIAHSDTQQTQALYQLSPKRRIALDGTPISNLPRNLLPLVAWASREGTASQPYGTRAPFITNRLYTSAASAERGIDRFRGEFVVTEWVTHQFEDGLESGAKREIPSLANLDLYREFVGRHILRRVMGEPDVAKHIHIDPPEVTVRTVAWDPDHLEHYVSTAEEFVNWYRRQRQDLSSQKLNLVTVLLRLGAANRAAAIPQDLKGPLTWTGGLTSKQRDCIDLLSSLDANGATTICFFESPVTAELIAGHLSRRGVEAVVYTGKRTRAQRKRDLNERFRTGKARVLLMTYGVGARGLNLPEASHTVLYDRMWSPRQESQAIWRALRVGRVGVLQVIQMHLGGSIDEYKAQMVAFKQDTANAGLDFATPEYHPDDYTHWLTILDRFCESIGRTRLQFSQRLDQAA